MLADQPVLVLDEPDAHLDHPTAELLAAEVLDGSREQAVLWITHAGVGLDRVDHVVDLGAVPLRPVVAHGRAGNGSGTSDSFP